MYYRRGFGLLELIFAVGLVALLAGGGLYAKEIAQRQSAVEVGNSALRQAEELQQTLNKRAEDQAKQLENPGTPPQPAAPSTADWKTYRNEQYGFEFRYPPGDILDIRKQGNGALSTIFINNDSNIKQSYQLAYNTSSSIKTLADAIQKRGPEGFLSYIYVNCADKTRQKCTEYLKDILGSGVMKWGRIPKDDRNETGLDLSVYIKNGKTASDRISGTSTVGEIDDWIIDGDLSEADKDNIDIFDRIFTTLRFFK